MSAAECDAAVAQLLRSGATATGGGRARSAYASCALIGLGGLFLGVTGPLLSTFVPALVRDALGDHRTAIGAVMAIDNVLLLLLVALVQAQGVSVICLADLPPSPPSKTRYVVKRLHAALPNVRILVGRWGPQALADDSAQLLRDAGATLVASTLAETRTYLGGLVEMPRIPIQGPSSVQAA
jgi:hypothetical protein